MRWLICAAFALRPMVGLSANIDPAPGEYLAKGGGGNLIVTRSAEGKLTFSIFTTGANQHTCGLEGTIQAGSAIVRLGDTDDIRPCLVTFSKQPGGIYVESEAHEGCRAFCGARAGFDGLYLKPAPGCDSRSVSRSRARFKQLYGRKEFAKAHTILASLMGTCSQTLDGLQTYWIRNDLAVTEYHLGQFSECLRTLEPFQIDLASTAEEHVKDLPPADRDSMLPIIQAARFNTLRCRDAQEKR